MSARLLGWGSLVAIVAMVSALAFMVFDRAVPLMGQHWRFVGWKEHDIALVQVEGYRTRLCDGKVTRTVYNGEGRNTHAYPFASYPTRPANELEIGAFTSDPVEFEIPLSVDRSEAVSLGLRIEYRRNPLQGLWPIVVEFPRLPLPMGDAP